MVLPLRKVDVMVAMTDRKVLAAAPAIAVPLIAGTVVGAMLIAKRVKRAATSTILAFGVDRGDVYYAAALAGDEDPRGRASSLADGGSEVRVAHTEADVFWAASLAGDVQPYETALGLPHID